MKALPERQNIKFISMPNYEIFIPLSLFTFKTGCLAFGKCTIQLIWKFLLLFPFLSLKIGDLKSVVYAF